MDELLKKYLANGLADFAGLHISGTVPVKQEMINEFIAQALEKAQAGEPANSVTMTPSDSDVPSEPSPSSSKSPKAKLPVKDLLRLVDRVEIKANEGVLTLEFDIRR